MTDTLKERAEKLDEQITKNTWLEAFNRKEYRPRVEVIEQALRDERKRALVEAGQWFAETGVDWSSGRVAGELIHRMAEHDKHEWPCPSYPAAAIRKDDTHEQQ